MTDGQSEFCRNQAALDRAYMERTLDQELARLGDEADAELERGVEGDAEKKLGEHEASP